MPANLFPGLWKSMRITLRAFWRIFRQFFHEATGALFAWFALYAVYAAWRQWKTRSMLWLMAFAIFYAMMMSLFALGSFCRARRVR